jgi:hypothetical protein
MIFVDKIMTSLSRVRISIDFDLFPHPSQSF